MNVFKILIATALLAIAAPAAAAERSYSRYIPTVTWAQTATQAVPLAATPQRAFALGHLSESVPLRIVVGLGMRDRAGADRLIRRQYTPNDVMFHNFLTPAQFTAAFNPTRAQAVAVAMYLQSKGFTNIGIEPNNLMVTATASASRAEAAFNTAIRATQVDGQVYYGNVTPAMVPSQLRGLVVSVLGLNNAYRMRTHIQVARYNPLAQQHSAGPQVAAANTPPPCLQVVNGICIGGEYSPPQYQVAYDACAKACTARYTSIAVMAEGDVRQVVKDLRFAENLWGLPQVPYSVVNVGVSSIDTSGLDEWDLDTQSSSGIAEKVKHLYVYDTTSLTDSDTALEFSHWVNDDLAQGGNSSFGEPETLAFADGSMQVDDEEFNQAAAQGQTMFASTGDNGEGCPVLAATGAPLTGVPVNCYPATSPYVVAVGGTTLDTNANGVGPGTYYGEHAWIATGGGFSTEESPPYWETNGIDQGATVLGETGNGRGMSDISMCADNNGCPMDVVVNEPATEGVGGTSLSSPLSMGVWARLESSNFNKLGFAAPVLYGVYGFYEPCPLGSKECVPVSETMTGALPPDTTGIIGGFHDILIGDNGLGAPAGPGWDTPTGLGSIDICAMQADIKNSIFSGH
jgi:pseudomonalisin